jgi:hypothetical protein
MSTFILSMNVTGEESRVYDQQAVWSNIAERVHIGELANQTVERSLVDINSFMREAKIAKAEWTGNGKTKGSIPYILTTAWKALLIPLEESGTKRIPWDKLDKAKRDAISQTVRNRVHMVKTCYEAGHALQFFNYTSQKKAPPIDLLTGDLVATGSKAGGTPRKQAVKQAGYWISKALQAEGALVVLQKLDILISGLDQEAIDELDTTAVRDLLIEACVMAKHLSADDATKLKEELTLTEGAKDE